MQQRIQVAAAMLAWSYLVALWRSDWIRASQILVVLKRFVRAHVDAFPQVASPAYASLRAMFQAMPVDDSVGVYDQLARWCLQLALAGVFPTVTVQYLPPVCGTGACAPGQGAIAAGTWAASLIAQRSDQTAPIWTAWHIVDSAAPQDAALHLTTWADNYVDGVDTTPAHTEVASQPNDALSRARAESPSIPTVPGTTEFTVHGRPISRASMPLWPFAIGGLFVVGIGAGLLLFKGKKSRRRYA
jgi:hypothetical protein